MAADLVRRRVAVIAAVAGTASAVAAKAATSTIPIVFAAATDPVRLGLVSSLSRPTGNITGATFRATEIIGKRLDLMRELVPSATTFAYLDNPDFPSPFSISDANAAVRSLGRQLVRVEARNVGEFEAAFADAIRRGAGAMFVGVATLFTNNCDKLAVTAAQYRLPTVYAFRQCVLAGGLMSYGTAGSDAYRVAGQYVGRILKGAKPSDLPIEQSTRFEMVINLQTAKALGLNVPLTLQVAADEVIE